MIIIEALRWLHILAGSVALLVLVVPLVARKGARLHRRAGWIFVGAMATVSVTAVVLGGFRMATAARPGVALLGAFLAYIGLLTGAGSWKGVRVLRTKHRTGGSRHPVDLALAALVLLAGLAVTWLGLRSGRWLLAIFGGLGVTGGLSDLRYWLRRPVDPRHWWFQHMGAMVGTSIAAITAFFVLNAPRLGLGSFSLLVWLGPTLVGVPGLMLWQRHYRRRFADTKTDSGGRLWQHGGGSLPTKGETSDEEHAHGGHGRAGGVVVVRGA